MKAMTRFILALGLVTSQLSLAEKLDLATHNNLIEKLESVTKSDSGDAMFLQTNLAYRLADLYAERARLLASDQEGQGEKIHAKQIAEDRTKAISILNKIAGTLEKSKKGPALLQVAHLQVIMGNTDKALKIYQQIEKNAKNFDGKSNAMVEIQLGDVAFSKGSYDEAKAHFQKSIALKENPRRGYSLWRLAWTNYNNGQTKIAEKQLIEILKTPSLFVSATGTKDASFQEDVSHDLALFMAKNDINNQSVATLSSLSPENTREKNLIFLATELDRTSKKVSALQVWKVIGTHEITLTDALDKQIQITRIQYDLGHKENLLVEVDRSVALIKNSKCEKNPECTVATQNLRRILTDWAKAEERTPSAELIIGFSKFTKSFDDAEMNYYAAQAASLRKQYKDAYQFDNEAVRILSAIKNRKDGEQKMFEGALLGSIEMAELSKDGNIRFEAYKKYLELNPNGEKASEVRYQIAHYYYETNNFSQASQEFRVLALDKKMPLNLREKSADLVLDSDVVLKDEKQIEAHSLELANTLPSKKQEFLVIYRKSVLNQSARILNDPKSTNQNYESELKKLDSVTIAMFPQDQLKQLIKNKIELSFRLKNIDSLLLNASTLVKQPKVTREEQEMALRHLAWVAEIKMNFKTAIKLLGHIERNAMQRPDYYFKIATLKELAGENPTDSYEKYLSVSKDQKKRQFAAHQIVLNSKKPTIQFKKYDAVLAKNKALYNSAAIYSFEKSQDMNLAKRLLTKASFRNSIEGQFVSHLIAFQNLDVLSKDLAQSKLDGKSDAKLKKVLVVRNQQIKNLENLANKAIKNKDTTLQLVYLSTTASKKNRLAQDILTLPTPKGLKASEKAQYQQQVQAMVQPYVTQAKAIQQKVSELWADANSKMAFQNLSECLVTQTKPGCQLAAMEVARLRVSSRQAGLAADPFEKLSETRQKTLVEAQNLQEKIQTDPFNFNDLAKMKTLQITLGRGPMVAYLNSRLNELQKERN